MLSLKLDYRLDPREREVHEVREWNRYIYKVPYSSMKNVAFKVENEILLLMQKNKILRFYEEEKGSANSVSQRFWKNQRNRTMINISVSVVGFGRRKRLYVRQGHPVKKGVRRDLCEFTFVKRAFLRK